MKVAEVLDEVRTLEEEQSSQAKPLTIELGPDNTSYHLPITLNGQIAASNSSPVTEHTLIMKTG